MNTIVDTAPPPAPQLPRIEPTDILRAAGHMGIGTAAGHALAEQLMAAAAPPPPFLRCTGHIVPATLRRLSNPRWLCLHRCGAALLPE